MHSYISWNWIITVSQQLIFISYSNLLLAYCSCFQYLKELMKELSFLGLLVKTKPVSSIAFSSL